MQIVCIACITAFRFHWFVEGMGLTVVTGIGADTAKHGRCGPRAVGGSAMLPPVRLSWVLPQSSLTPFPCSGPFNLLGGYDRPRMVSSGTARPYLGWRE